MSKIPLNTQAFKKTLDLVGGDHALFFVKIELNLAFLFVVDFF